VEYYFLCKPESSVSLFICCFKQDMEFDLEDFMFEVTSALQYNDPLQFQRPERTVTKHGINHRPQESLEPATAHEDLDSTQRGLSVAGCQPVPSVLSDERQIVPEPGNQSAENVSRDINDGSRYKSKHHDILEPIYPGKSIKHVRYVFHDQSLATYSKI
jgi:hypothetical protein